MTDRVKTQTYKPRPTQMLSASPSNFVLVCVDSDECALYRVSSRIRIVPDDAKSRPHTCVT